MKNLKKEHVWLTNWHFSFWYWIGGQGTVENHPLGRNKKHEIVCRYHLGLLPTDGLCGWFVYWAYNLTYMSAFMSYTNITKLQKVVNSPTVSAFIEEGTPDADQVNLKEWQAHFQFLLLPCTWCTFWPGEFSAWEWCNFGAIEEANTTGQSNACSQPHRRWDQSCSRGGWGRISKMQNITNFLALIVCFIMIGGSYAWD